MGPKRKIAERKIEYCNKQDCYCSVLSILVKITEYLFGLDLFTFLQNSFMNLTNYTEYFYIYDFLYIYISCLFMVKYLFMDTNVIAATKKI